MTPRLTLAIAMSLALAACNFSSFESFDIESFRAAQERGDTIVLHFYDDF